ncbi:MAG: NAD(P)/FAD-dependent oxidoreductase [Acidobacteria bacterium]|nr:NAD(P)/FAD-dependent oxidoreductase [Acidobacteriota bacterium]
MLDYPSDRPRIVIVGAGFGGLNAAKQLGGDECDVVVIDRVNHHLFQPLLYQVATAALSPADISYPIRAVLRNLKRTRTLLGEVVGIDTTLRRVYLHEDEIPYDYLILAAGARHSYFGNKEWERIAPGLKGLDDALEIRRRILLAFEKAEREVEPARRKALLTFVVIGGGPTGVELAGAIAEIAKQVMVDDFRSIDPTDTRVILAEGGPRILATFPEELSKKAESALRDKGVWVWANTLATEITEDRVAFKGADPVATRTVLWAAGVQASPLGRMLGAATDRAGRVPVEPDLSVKGLPNVFVIGDLASLNGKDGKPLPGVAPVAMQQGRHVGKNILRAIEGKPLLPFEYRDKGNLATIGRAAAIADLGFVRLSGFVAWMAWLFVHVLYLIGFRNRAAVMLNWTWAYLKMQRGARLIYGDVERLVEPSEHSAGHEAEPEPASQHR